MCLLQTKTYEPTRSNGGGELQVFRVFINPRENERVFNLECYFITILALGVVDHWPELQDC